MVLGQELVFEDPEIMCFGCSRHDDRGLRAHLRGSGRRPRRRPGGDLTLRGEVLRTDGRDYLGAGEILDADGQLLTSALARWRRVG